MYKMGVGVAFESLAGFMGDLFHAFSYRIGHKLRFIAVWVPKSYKETHFTVEKVPKGFHKPLAVPYIHGAKPKENVDIER
jgi:hypothetical protein